METFSDYAAPGAAFFTLFAHYLPPTAVIFIIVFFHIFYHHLNHLEFSFKPVVVQR